MDIFNEAKLILMMYHIILFTPLVPEAETKFKIGYSCCGALVISVIINLLQMILEPVYLTKKRCKIRYALKRAKQNLRSRPEQLGKCYFNRRKKREHEIQAQADEEIEASSDVHDIGHTKVEILGGEP